MRKLIDQAEGPGLHAVSFDGMDEAGRRLTAGVYVMRLSADGAVRTGKLVVVR